MIPPPPLSGLLGCQWMPLWPDPPPPAREDQLARVSSPDTPSQCVCVCVCVCACFFEVSKQKVCKYISYVENERELELNKT